MALLELASGAPHQTLGVAWRSVFRWFVVLPARVWGTYFPSCSFCTFLGKVTWNLVLHVRTFAEPAEELRV